ncbi:MAG: beta-ketoacyl synthase N-terminal-like domain-containing protein, partial [Bauldia litoralis]|uniref:beta-ketoacyl synthase N-terminal-like domain-containing protein n=1 Tax=Bauldia litoralis TaxID=665467 RepID=UPI003299A0D4
MALRDKRDRPVVAVTGMGVVSSLGTGLEDNWTALVAGRSGIKEITRFPTTHLRTTFAGTVDFPEVDPRDLKLTIGELAIDEAVRMSGIGKPGDFPGPLFTAIPPAELGWPARRRLYEAVGPEAGEDAYDRMCRAAGQA